MTVAFGNPSSGWWCVGRLTPLWETRFNVQEIPAVLGKPEIQTRLEVYYDRIAMWSNPGQGDPASGHWKRLAQTLGQRASEFKRARQRLLIARSAASKGDFSDPELVKLRDEPDEVLDIARQQVALFLAGDPDVPFAVDDLG